MALLERYKKPGGFIQLLSLIETCAPSKQTKLLETVALENRIWADHVRSKMLSIERIYSWNDETLMEIFGTLQDLTISVAIHAAEQPLKARLQGFITHSRQRKIDDLYGAKIPTANEVASTHVKIIETVRKMASDGFVRFEKCDADLAIDENIEDLLGKIPAVPVPAEPSSLSSAPNVDPASSVTQSESSDGRAGAEVQLLKKKVVDLGKENAILRHELSVAKSKLDQIKKIA